MKARTLAGGFRSVTSKGPRIALPTAGRSLLMSVKGATFLALVGTLLLAVLIVWNFVVDIASVVRGLIPAARLVSQAIYAFAAVTLACFFYVFQKQG